MNNEARLAKGNMAPLECMYCDATGPMYPVDADHCGWMCDACYQKMQNETENQR